MYALKKHNDLRFPLAFECQKCGSCCRNLSEGIPFFIEDVRQLSVLIKKSFSYILMKYCSFQNYIIETEENLSIAVPMLTLKTPKGCCPFLLDNKCAVHSHKPYYCRAAPFISVFFEDIEIYSMNVSTCCGFGKGKKYSEEEIIGFLLLEEQYLSFEHSQYLSWFYDYASRIFKKEVNNGKTTRWQNGISTKMD